MWGPIIVALVQFLGPLLLEAFRAWLTRRLSEEAAKMPQLVTVREADTRAYQVRLLERVRDRLWFWQVGKKRAVNDCIAAVKRGSIIGLNKIGE